MYLFPMTRSIQIERILIVCFCLLNAGVFAQNSNAEATTNPDYKLHKKGWVFINFGYNRAWYNKSDIHFTGQGHEFVLNNVRAADRPTPIGLVYIGPTTWSIPQFNFHLGYFFSDQYSIAIGWDHMKYIANDLQMVKMNGWIDPGSITDGEMRKNMQQLNGLYASNGIYNDVLVQMTPDDFVHVEHTDGLNYASIEADRYLELWQSTKHKKLGFTLVGGLGTGLVIPRTDAHLFGSGDNHYWNLAGWGASAKLGFQFNLTRRIYFQTDFKYGHLQLNHIHTTNYLKADKAKQHIVFYESLWQIGFRI
jgi:hypothetical protein